MITKLAFAAAATAAIGLTGYVLHAQTPSPSAIERPQAPTSVVQRTPIQVVDPPAAPSGEGIDFSVRVLDASTGDPVAGVAIELNRPAAASDRRTWTYKGTTDGGGQVRFTAMLADRYSLAATLAGRTLVSESVKNVTLSRDVKPTPVILRMHRSSRIEGIVQDSDAKPVAGVTVELLQEQWTAGQRLVARVKTSPPTKSDGAFIVDAVLPGPYYLRARPSPAVVASQLEQSDKLPKPADRHVAYVNTLYPSDTVLETAQRLLIVEGVNRPDVTITVQKSKYYRISGKVGNLSPDVKGPNLIFIRTVSAASRFPFLAGEPYDEASPTQIAPDGKFTFERGLPPGPYWAGYTPGGVGERFGGIDFVVEDRDLELNTELWKSTPFEGKAVYEDGSPARIQGTLRNFWSGRSTRSDSFGTGADGTFSRQLYSDGVFRLDLSGNYALKKIDVNGRIFNGPEFELPAIGGPVVITVTDKGGMISGNVELHSTTKVYPRGVVTLSLDPLNPLDFPQRHRLDATDTFKFDHLPVGRYRVCAWVEEGSEINRVLNNPAYETDLLASCKSVDVKLDDAKTIKLKQISANELNN